MGEKQVTIQATLKTLMNEAYGACAWLEGLITLSNRARAYKVKKLRGALADAETCLQTLDSERAMESLPRLP